MGMPILPAFPLSPQDAHVSNSNISLTFPLCSHFLSQKLLPTFCLFDQCPVISHYFQRPTRNHSRAVTACLEPPLSWEVTKPSTICLTLHLLCYFSCHINLSYVTLHQLPAVYFSFAKPELPILTAAFSQHSPRSQQLL